MAALWSNKEYLNKESYLVIERRDINGNFEVYDYIDIKTMSTNKNCPYGYSYVFDDFTFGVRIRVETNDVQYGDNKGRIVL